MEHEALFTQISEKCHVDLEAVKRISLYLQEMLVENQKVNLTNIEDFHEALIFHVEDSLLPVEFLQNKKITRIADIGSGCGFPGVAVSVALNTATTLIDSTSKKLAAVSKALERTGIKNISTLARRIEEAPDEHIAAYDLVTARALSSLPSILELASPLTSKNGLFLAYKSAIEDDERETGKNVAKTVGFTLIDTIEGFLLDGISKRSVLVFQKTHVSSIPLPRRNGMAQKRPLR